MICLSQTNFDVILLFWVMTLTLRRHCESKLSMEFDLFLSDSIFFSLNILFCQLHGHFTNDFILTYLPTHGHNRPQAAFAITLTRKRHRRSNILMYFYWQCACLPHNIDTNSLSLFSRYSTARLRAMTFDPSSLEAT